MFTKEEIETLRKSQRLQVIDAQVSFLGSLNHDYYHANPAVSSDFFMVLRYGLAPGSEGRPLGVTENGLWKVYDGYPGEKWVSPKKP